MKKRLGLLIIFVLTILLCFGCSHEMNGVVIEDVMIPNSHGTYTKAQIIVPADYESHKVPLVSLSHGFHGTMNSAGMDSLAEALAEEGIATIRMDFSHRLSENPKSKETSQYTIETMIEDQVLCIDYMVEHYGADPERVGLFGRSLGGRAVMAAANESAGGYEYKGLVLVAPAGNGDAFQRYMGGSEKWEKFKKQADKQGSVTHQKVVLTPDFFRSIEDYIPSEQGFKFKHPVLTFYNTEDHVVLPEASIECGTSYPDHRLIEVTSAKSPHGLEMGFEESEIKDMIFKEITEFYKENL